ncbi:MAG: ATP-binding cassette domain-containing protein [Firmicutes bacterium]|nr:ATP-binding cassette domain-containing protein [Bacillota bacterium]
MSETVIKLSKVTKRYNIYRKNIQRITGILFGKEPTEVKQALTDVTLRIEKGERVAVFGKMDDGRTTLLSIIAGIYYPTNGKVQVKGKINAMMVSKIGLVDEFTCRENIYMKANVVGIPKKEISQYEDEIIQFAEMEDYADLPLKRAPKGTATLLALAVHLKAKADILIADEVSGGGGNRRKEKCENKIAEYLKENEDMTAVMVSTRPAFARKVCTRGIVLQEGRIIYDGDIKSAVMVLRGENLVEEPAETEGSEENGDIEEENV